MLTLSLNELTLEFNNNELKNQGIVRYYDQETSATINYNRAGTATVRGTHYPIRLGWNISLTLSKERYAQLRGMLFTHWKLLRQTSVINNKPAWIKLIDNLNPLIDKEPQIRKGSAVTNLEVPSGYVAIYPETFVLLGTNDIQETIFGVNSYSVELKALETEIIEPDPPI